MFHLEMKTYKERAINWLRINWMIIVVIILLLFLLTRLDVPPSWKN